MFKTYLTWKHISSGTEEVKKYLQSHYDFFVKVLIFSLGFYFVFSNHVLSQLFDLSAFEAGLKYLVQGSFLILFLEAFLVLFALREHKRFAFWLFVSVVLNLLCYERGWVTTLIRHGSVLIWLGYGFLYVWKKSKSENQKAQQAFFSLCFCLYILLQAVMDINARFSLGNIDPFKFFMLEKTQMLFLCIPLFVMIEFLVSFKENEIRYDNLFFSVAIFLVYGLLFLYFVANYKQQLLWNVPAQGGIFPFYFFFPQMGIFLFFILYHYSFSKYRFYICALLVLLNVHFQNDGPFNYNLIIGYTLMQVLGFMPEHFCRQVKEEAVL